MMACVDFVESVGVSEGFMDCPSYCSPAPYGWLDPRISFSKEFADEAVIEEISEEERNSSSSTSQQEEKRRQHQPGMEDNNNISIGGNENNNDFEFCLSLSDDPLSMLPADELFYQGKLMPLQCPSRSGPLSSLSSMGSDGGAIINKSTIRRNTNTSTCTINNNNTSKPTRIQDICNSVDPLSVSPKAPKCSSRWKELLGLKKIQTPKHQHQEILSLQSPQPQKTPLSTKAHLTPKSLKQLFRGLDSKLLSSSSSFSSDLSSQPLLTHQSPRDSDGDSASARLSVSSSCAADLEEMPRYSLDSEKGNPNPIRVPLRVNVRKPRTTDVDGRGGRLGRSPYRNIEAKLPPRGSSVDSPRMNSSGKIVFHGLERSCSSPSSLSANMRGKDPHYRNARHKENWRGMERSYSANVRVTPVLNVPVCSLRASKGGSGAGGSSSSSKGTMFGFTQLFSPQKKETSKPSRNPCHTPLGNASSSISHRREG